jgi:hypothetical protein
MATRRATRKTSGHPPERRKSLRLRSLIDQFNARLKENRHDLDVQFIRLAQIQAEVDTLNQSASKRARHEGQTPSPRTSPAKAGSHK